MTVDAAARAMVSPSPGSVGRTATARPAPGAAAPRWLHSRVVVPVILLAAAVGLLTPDYTVATTVWFAVAGGAVASAWLGVHRAPTGTQAVPALVATGLTSYLVASLLWAAATAAGGSPEASIGDLPVLVAYLALAGALVLNLGRSVGRAGVTLDWVVDGLTILVVSCLVFWLLTSHSGLWDRSDPLDVRVMTFAYPVLDALLLALTGRTLADPRARRAIGGPFTAGVLCWLVGDVMHLLGLVSAAAGYLPEILWLGGSILIATAAWRRPATGPDPEEAPQDALGGRLAVAILPLLLPPGLDLVSHGQGWDTSPFFAMVGSTLLLGLAYVRTARLLASERRARATARAAHRHHAKLAVNTSDAMVVVDGNGLVREHSPHLRLFVEAMRRTGPPRLADLVLGVDRREVERTLTSALRRPRQVVSSEFRTELPDGTDAWYALRLVNLLDDPDVEGVVVTLADVTERKRFEVALGVARDAALEGSRTKSEFLANMSHEIRTPMNGVLGLARLLLTTDLDDRQRDYAQRLHGAGEVLLRIIDDILDLSRAEAGKLTLEALEFDPAEVVEEAAAQVAAEAGGKGLRLTTNVAPDVPRWVSGDPSRLRQVVLHLASNAVKFTDHGEVAVAASVDGADEGPVHLRVEVRDTGIGIEPGMREHLFSPFAQADSSSTRRHGGTGLGLAICRHVIAAMGGTLGVESAPGQGSTFWLSVPLTVVTPPSPPLPAPAAALEAGEVPARPAPPPAPPGSKGRLLVAEDNLVNQLVATGILEHLGYQVEVVADGREAVEAWAAGSFDAVLMDCQMPVLDGFEATREIRRREPPGRRTPIVAMTAATRPEDRDRCREAGMDGHVSKPVSPSQVAAVLSRSSTTRP